MPKGTQDRNLPAVRIAKLHLGQPRHLSPWVIDAGIALAAGVLTVAAIASADESGSVPPDPLAYSLGIAAAGGLAWRRRFPVAVVAGSK
jgi:hypothetical protein